MRSRSTIEVRYAETDAMGVVYHANYLVWFEVARTQFLADLDYPYARVEQEGYMAPVLHVDVDYGMSLRYGDTAEVEVRLVKLSGARTVFNYEIWRKGQDRKSEKPCCTGNTVHCLIDAKSFKAINMKRAVPELYAAYERVLEPLGE